MSDPTSVSKKQAATLTSPLARYSHARRVGPLLFIAGQGCRDARTNAYAGLTMDGQGQVASYDIRAQTAGVLANIEAVLAAKGLDRRALVDINVFLTDMSDFAGMNEVWNAFFADVPVPPTRTTVAVKQLPGLNFVEMKATASFEGAE
jgi:2-aminomuconate deaminase